MPSRETWREAVVDTSEEHFEITWGDIGGREVRERARGPVALVGRPVGGEFPVRFLPENTPTDVPAQDVLADVRRELDYYLVGKVERDHWDYMIHHAGTAANVYSKVHWSLIRPASP